MKLIVYVEPHNVEEFTRVLETVDEPGKFFEKNVRVV